MWLRRLALTVLVSVTLTAGACNWSTSTGAAPPPTYPPGAWTAAPPLGAEPVPGQPAPPPPAIATPATPGGISPAGATDPINRSNVVWMRERAQALYSELIQALAAGPKTRITGIPLAIDDSPGEVNAFAACTASGKSLIAITDGLLEVGGYLAQCAANDEIFRTNKTTEYIQLLAKNQRPDQPLVRPGAGFFEPAQQHDAAKLARQHQLFDEQVAFVLAHEMAHHYLGHLPCTAGNVSASEVGMVLTSVVPVFNQVNETGADTAGTYNLLDAGRRRSSHALTEGGALLTMRFFAGLNQWSALDILFAFEQTHPPAELRAPLIQQTANTWRATNGAPLPWVR